MFQDTKKLLSESKFYEGYSRYNDDLKRYETWDEAVDRVMDMHRTFYKDKLSDRLETYLQEATESYKEKRVLGAQRALQFGGDQLIRHQMKIYNCTSSYADRPEFFGEFFYILLCGAGAGFSVQRHHISRLPKIAPRNKQPKTHVVEDSIEGWATALDVLLSSYFEGGGKHPEFEGRKVYFDLNNIRPKGARISGGFKAPGPEPLRLALDKIEYILQGIVLSSKKASLRPIHAYDICMHAADAVLSGGVRRSATICLFSPDDEEMAKAKTGNWFVDNPQRGRSNNSAVIVRKKANREQFSDLMSNIRQYGEPGFLFVESPEHTTNPCVTGDTWVTTINGSRQIIDLIGVGRQELLLNGKWVSTTDHGFVQTGVKPVFQLTLDNGLTIKATEDHKFMTDRGWVELKSLNTEDFVFVSNNMENSLNDNTSFEEGWLIGNFIGDGTFTKNSARWNYWGEEKSLGFVCENYLKKMNFPSKINRDYDSERQFEIKQEVDVQSIESSRFSSYIEEKYNIFRGNKTITNHLEKSGFNIMKGVVSGLFDSDGTVYGNAEKGITVAINQSNIEILRSVQRVLVQNGIMSKIIKDRDEGWNVLPDGQGGEKEYWTRENYRLYVSGKYSVSRFFDIFTPQNKIKVDRFKKIVSQYKRETYKPKMFFSRVKDILLTDIEPVFDCSVPETTSFEANGMWIHNCVEIGMFPQIDGKSGWQGCVSFDTKLITKDGIEIIGEAAHNKKQIEIWNGQRWSKVIPVQTGENRKLYRIKFGDGSFLDCTDNHKFLVKNRFESVYREVTTLEIIDILNTEQYTISVPRSDIQYETGTPEPLSYDYGFILGDGCCTIYEGSIRVPFAEIYENEFKINFPFSDKGTNGQISINGKGTQFYRHYFRGANKEFSFELKYGTGLPKKLFSWDRKSIVDFFAGWIDSDGTKTTNGVRIYGKEDKIRDGQLLLSKIGINSSVNLMQEAGTKTNLGDRKNSVWYLQVCDVSKDMWCAKFNISKRETSIAKSKYQTVKSVESLPGFHDSYCFEEAELHQGVFNNVLTKQCNLTEINGGMCGDEEAFYKACRAASILGTLQAGYTNFRFLSDISKQIFDREALLGVSITGWMNNPEILFNKKILERGAEIVKKVNREVAKLIGINVAARTTCVKPSGNASVLLMTASGIHAEHSPMYIRHIQLNKETEVAQLIKKTNPYMVEESVWSSTKSDYVVAFPIMSNKNSIFKDDLIGIKHLELVKIAQKHWVEAGTNVDLCADPDVRHNVSNTIVVDNWDEVEEYIFKNRDCFAGISCISKTGDKDYAQAPNTMVMGAEEIVKQYGAGGIFASGMVVDGLKAFNNLWMACMTANGMGEDISSDDNVNLLKKDWVRRFEKFTANYFDGDKKKAEYCLKDVYNLHKWNKICQNFIPINWVEQLQEKKFIEIDTVGAQACYSGACEI